uniref:Uncharacterized protein n=1 Tax=Glossina pallidipes TaxID=7398 RepID=A0A1A9Z8K7_GLOPL
MKRNEMSLSSRNYDLSSDIESEHWAQINGFGNFQFRYIDGLQIMDDLNKVKSGSVGIDGIPINDEYSFKCTIVAAMYPGDTRENPNECPLHKIANIHADIIVLKIDMV